MLVYQDTLKQKHKFFEMSSLAFNCSNQLVDQPHNRKRVSAFSTTDNGGDSHTLNPSQCDTSDEGTLKKKWWEGNKVISIKFTESKDSKNNGIFLVTY